MIFLLFTAVAAGAILFVRKEEAKLMFFQLTEKQANATGAKTADTCATGFSWKGAAPGWLKQAFGAAQVAAAAIPIPGVAQAVGIALNVALGLLEKFKVGGERSATVNPNSLNGEGVSLPVGSWTGVRNVDVTVYLQARRLDDKNLWYLLYGPDNEGWCYEMEGASQLSTVVATWETSGKPSATGELAAPELVFNGVGRFGNVVLPNGQKDQLPDKLANYYRGAPYPIGTRWAGKVGSWMRPVPDRVTVGVVRTEGTDDFELRVWLPARIGALRWTVFYKVS